MANLYKLSVATVALFSMISVNAMAQDVPAETVETVTEVTVTSDDGLAPTAEIVPAIDRIAVVCGLPNVILSDAAMAVCDGTAQSPSLISDGSRFDNRGVGREFNVLYVNAANFATGD